MEKVELVEPDFCVFKIGNSQRECIAVEIFDSEFELCDNKSKNFWSNNKTGTYGAGLINTQSDPYKVTRTGLLGQMAFSKIFNVDLDLSYKEFGDEYDHKIGKWTVDIKCASYNYGSGLIYHKNESERIIPLKNDIYVFGFVDKELKNEKYAKIVFVGFSLKSDVQKSPVKLGFKGKKHYNYVIEYSATKSIKSLYEIKNKFYV